MASYLVVPGDLRLPLGSPPSRCSITSVVRLSALIRETPAMYLPSPKLKSSRIEVTRALKMCHGMGAIAFGYSRFWLGGKSRENTGCSMNFLGSYVQNWLTCG